MQVSGRLDHLRAELAKKTPSRYASQGTYRRELKRCRGLIGDLEEELAALDCPGEYEELPVAVVADELGLQVRQIRRLIKLGEVEAAGRGEGARVSRAELGRAAGLGPGTLLALADEGAGKIFAEAAASLRAGDVPAAERAYGRIKARETCVGDYALALEIALGLVKGEYAEAGAAVRFVLREKLGDREAICAHVGRVLRGARLGGVDSEGEVLRLYKLLGGGALAAAGIDPGAGGVELMALYVVTAVQGAIRGFITENLPPGRRGELLGLLRDGVFTSPYAQARAERSIKCRAYVADTRRKIPRFWGPLNIWEGLDEE